MNRQWSKVKATFEQHIAPELKGRLQVHVASYRSGGRGWIVFDKTEIVSVEAPGWTRKLLGHGACVPLVEGDTVELGKACGELPQIAISDALASPNPLLRGLAILDARCGKRTLQRLRTTHLDSFSSTMLAIRDVALGREPLKIVCEQCGEQLHLSTSG
ncbi:MAG: hypothetical protein AB1717_00920 [Pseudomonadota bacterium]